MKKNKIFFLGLALSAVPFLLGMIFYHQLPDTLAVHFDFQGRPDGFTGKNTALFLLPLGMTLAFIVMYFFTVKDPRHRNQNKTLNYFMFLTLPILNILLSALIIGVGLGREMRINYLITAAVGLLFTIVGNFLPKVKRNYTVGIKLPWTLHSDVVWEKTHRLAGYLWMLGGVIVMAASFLVPTSIIHYVILSSVIMMTGIPGVYSYIVYKKEANTR